MGLSIIDERELQAFSLRPWYRYRDYRLVELDAKDTQGRRFTGLVIEAVLDDPEELPEAYDVDREHRRMEGGLPMQFLDCKGPEDYLRFARRYGLLGLGELRFSQRASSIRVGLDPALDYAILEDHYFERAPDEAAADPRRRPPDYAGDHVQYWGWRPLKPKASAAAIRSLPHRVEPVSYWNAAIRELGKVAELLSDPGTISGAAALIHLDGIYPEAMVDLDGNVRWAWSYDTLLDAMYMLLLSDYAAKGNWRQIRKCPNCGRFFRPSRADQKFCSTSCRVRHYQKRNQPNGKHSSGEKEAQE